MSPRARNRVGWAIATHLQHQQSIVFPAFIQAWVWATAFVRLPKLFARSHPAGGGGILSNFGRSGSSRSQTGPTEVQYTTWGR